MTTIAKRALTRLTHLLVECQDCEFGILNDVDVLCKVLSDLLASADQPVVDHMFHEFRPNGVTGFVMTEFSRVNIHTWPEKLYASADLFIDGKVDVEQVEERLREALGARDVQVTECRRGDPDKAKMEVLNHRRVETHHIDLRGAVPEGVRLGVSDQRGFGLFADRHFSAGDLIYVARGGMVAWEAELVIQTDLGRTLHSGDSYGYEIGGLWVDLWSEQVRNAIIQQYQLENPTTAELIASVTQEEAMNTIILGVDGLTNHSGSPNVELQWSEATLNYDECGRPVWAVPLRALHPILEGQELFQDYSRTLPDYIAPHGWEE